MREFLRELKRDADETSDRSIGLITVMLGFICLFMCVLNMITQTMIMSVITGCLGVWCILNYLVYKKTQSYMILSIGTLAAVGVMMMYFVVSGGKDGFSIVWLLIIPPLGIFFYKLIYGGTFSIIIGFLTTIYMWTPLHEIGYEYSDTYLLRFPIVYSFITVVCIYINYTLWAYRKKQVMLLEMAQQASNTKSDFLANMSHEIRTPLNAVVGMCELILRESDISNTVRDYCFNIQNSGRSLLAIINDILDFSKIESGKMEVVPENFNISSTINDVINMAITRKGDKPIEIIVKCDTDIPKGLIGDELRIRQIMINLVTNAIKFTNNGCVVLKISQTKHDYGINLSVSVSDTGIGISPENLEKLFSSFQQINTKKNRDVEGTGLGLAISKKFINSMGGFINVSSIYGSGSEFKFVIPLKVSDPTPFISIKEADKITAACFIDTTKFRSVRVAKEYTTLISELKTGFGTKVELFDTFQEFSYAASQTKYSHIFVGKEEYIANSSYFNKLSDDNEIIVIQDRINEISLPSKIKCIYKPFYALTIAAALNNENLLGNINERRNSDIRFIAPKAKVLVVDDNVINLKVAVGLMRPYHMQVVTAESGREAISVLQSQDIDMVFMDHMMPEMDGIEATKEIRNMDGDYYRNLPVIALTANAVNGVRDMYIEAGLNDFMAKPIELSTLDRVLKTWLPKELIEEFSKSEYDSEKTCGKSDKTKTESNGDSLFNSETGVFYTGGDVEAYNEILEVFVCKTPEKHSYIRKLFEEKSWKNYVIEVHALKSSSLTIGSKDLSELAKELEMAGKNQNYSLIEEKNNELLEMYLKVAELGQKYLELNEKNDDVAEEKKELTEITQEKVEEYIAQLKVACDAFDGDAIVKICEEASECVIGEIVLKPLFDEVKAAANDFEYDSAAEKASEISDKIK